MPIPALRNSEDDSVAYLALFITMYGNPPELKMNQKRVVGYSQLHGLGVRALLPPRHGYGQPIVPRTLLAANFKAAAGSRLAPRAVPRGR